MTPKLLVGLFIKEDNDIRPEDKVKLLAEIMHLNEDELESWIQLTILDEGAIGKTLKRGIASVKYHAGRPVRTLLKGGVIVGAGAGVAQVGRQFTDTVSGCKYNCQKQFDATGNGARYSNCLDACRNGQKQRFQGMAAKFKRN